MKYFDGEIAILIVVSPMASLYIDKLVTQYLVGFKRVYVIEIYAKPIVKDADEFNLARFNYNTGVGKVLAFRDAVKYIKSLVFEYASVSFFIAHPLHLVTNYVARLSESLGMSLNLIPDGILNYYDCSVCRFKKQIALKKIFSPLMFMGFFKIGRSCIGFDVFSYSSIFALSKNNLFTGGCKDINIINFDIDCNTSPPSCGLIIGLPMDSIKFEALVSLIDRMVVFLKSKGVCGIYYKAHPSEKFDERFLEYLQRLGIGLCHSDEIAESLTNEYAVFVSAYSSALPNIKIISPGSICAAFLSVANDILPVDHVQAIKLYFEGVGVEVYD